MTDADIQGYTVIGTGTGNGTGTGSGTGTGTGTETGSGTRTGTGTETGTGTGTGTETGTAQLQSIRSLCAFICFSLKSVSQIIIIYYDI